jgi:hypothetical protein
MLAHKLYNSAKKLLRDHSRLTSVGIALVGYRRPKFSQGHLSNCAEISRFNDRTWEFNDTLVRLISGQGPLKSVFYLNFDLNPANDLCDDGHHTNVNGCNKVSQVIKSFFISRARVQMFAECASPSFKSSIVKSASLSRLPLDFSSNLKQTPCPGSFDQYTNNGQNSSAAPTQACHPQSADPVLITESIINSQLENLRRILSRSWLAQPLMLFVNDCRPLTPRPRQHHNTIAPYQIPLLPTIQTAQNLMHRLLPLHLRHLLT